MFWRTNNKLITNQGNIKVGVQGNPPGKQIK